MLSYQHSYHAGNFADVMKHVALTRLLHYMTQKPKPLLYLETHAGRGLYDIKDSHALKTGEAKQGVEQLWAAAAHLPALFTPWLQSIKNINTNNKLRFYPGSPYLALQGLRADDRLRCFELHPGEFEHLHQLPSSGKRILCEHANGLEQLSSLLPPPERRGLIFIDPSYEVKNEYQQIPILLNAAYRRFATGVYCLWYPIINDHYHEKLLRGLARIEGSSHLQIEFYLTKMQMDRMSGCGLWVINPPYLFAEEMKSIMKTLCSLINPGVSSFKII